MRGAKEGAEKVPIHEAQKPLTVKYLHALEESIRARTPLKGENIDIVYVDGGAIISSTGGGLSSIAGGGTPEPVALTVCSNGTPTTITVVKLT
ncbi:hypothetical protein EBS02_07170 [bacterium]|nr:hypothetical protein [bacterium]